MTRLDDALRADLEEVRAAGLHRVLRRAEGAPGPRIRLGGRTLVNFASNDYLGLARHPGVAEAAARAARDFGGGSAASRLMAGSLDVHHRLEEAIAAWQGAGASIVFSSGFAAALGTVPALVGPADYVVVDRLVHACCIDAAKLSRAQLRVFRHNDAGHLDGTLKRLRAKAPRARILVITESIFSMDGDPAPLAALAEVKERWGAWLMVDEAHAAGLHGARRSGLVEAAGLGGRVDVHMGTLSKALGASGGYIAGSAVLAEWLVNRARSFIYSTAPAPAASAAALAALEILRGAEGAEAARRTWENAGRAHAIIPVAGRDRPPGGAILPWIVGSEPCALEAAARLAGHGVFAPAIRFPTVPHGAARLRFAVTAAHDGADFDQLAAALAATPETGP